MSNQSAVHLGAGTPAGGQFATMSRAEANLVLTVDRPTDLASVAAEVRASSDARAAQMNALGEIADEEESWQALEDRQIDNIPYDQADLKSLLEAAEADLTARSAGPTAHATNDDPDAELAAAWRQQHEATHRAELLTTRKLAQQILAAEPNARYLNLYRREHGEDEDVPFGGEILGGNLATIHEDLDSWAEEIQAQHNPETVDAGGLTADLRTSSLDFNQHILRQKPLNWAEGPTYRLDLVAAANQK